MFDVGEGNWMSDDMFDIEDQFDGFVPEGTVEASEWEVDPSLLQGGGEVHSFGESMDVESMVAGAVVGAAMGEAGTPVQGAASQGTHGPIAGGPSIYRGRGTQYNPGKQIGAVFPSRETEGEFDVGYEVEHIQHLIDLLNTKLRELEQIKASNERPKKYTWLFKIACRHNPRFNGRGPTHMAFLVDTGAIRTEPSGQRPTSSILAEAFKQPPVETTPGGEPPAIVSPGRVTHPEPQAGTVEAAAQQVVPPKKATKQLWRID